MQEKSYTDRSYEEVSNRDKAIVYELSVHDDKDIWMYLQEKNHNQLSQYINDLEIQADLVTESMTVNKNQCDLVKEKQQTIEKEVQNKLGTLFVKTDKSCNKKVVWSYYMTKNNWQKMGELSADNLELIGEAEVSQNRLIPKNGVEIKFPSDRQGHHLIVAMSDDLESDEGFYHVVEINI